MTTAELPQSKPYKGTASYQVEDRDFFFGRAADAERLLARVLSARFTLLHAQSGAGKTSVVNATAIPELERRGWTPVRILPHNNPVASARGATLLSVMPSPQVELAAIDRVIAAIPDAAELTIDQLLATYDSLRLSDPRRRSLISPVCAAEGTAASPDVTQPVVPCFSRLLRSTIDVEAFSSHIAAVRQGGDANPFPDDPIDGSTPLRQVREIIGSDDFAARYKTLLAYLDPPSPKLWPFLLNLLEVYGARRSQFALILIFDQFEEIFTRFVDPGTAVHTTTELPDWRLRYDFFEQLKEVYCGRLADGELPSIRFLISMRSEYVAQLGPIQEFAPEIDQSRFHLKLLSKEGALDAIRRPASIYDYGYTEDCYRRIVSDLLKEDRYVEPAHLSLICEKLWAEKDQPVETGGSAAQTARVIDLDIYDVKLKGAKGILRAFLRDYLDGLPTDDDRNESLELLDPLITGTGTRNIVERRQLVNVPFRDAMRRQMLLQGLVDRTIVRVEVRLGGSFVEITHEFLIPSIHEAMQDILFRDGDYLRLKDALQTLRGAGHSVGTDLEGVISRGAFLALHAQSRKVVWSPSTKELMFRAAIFYGHKDAAKRWAEEFAAMPEDTDVPAVLERVMRGDQARGFLSAQDLRLLNANRDTTDLTQPQAMFVLRSQIEHASPSNKDDIRYWARRAGA